MQETRENSKWEKSWLLGHESEKVSGVRASNRSTFYSGVMKCSFDVAYKIIIFYIIRSLG